MKKLISFIGIIALIMTVSCQPTTLAGTDTGNSDNSGNGGGNGNGGNGGNGENGGNGGSEAVTTITIDGDFSDWANIDQTKLFTAKNHRESLWEGVSQIKVFNTEDAIYYYAEYESDVLETYIADGSKFPGRINLNTDGEFASGYDKYYLQKYDFMFEGNFDDGNGNWGSFDLTLYQRIGSEWSPLGKGILSGMGKDNQLEMKVDKAKFNEATNKGTSPMPIGDTFQTGMTFYYTAWNEAKQKEEWVALSVLPNAANTDNGGKANLLEITSGK